MKLTSINLINMDSLKIGREQAIALDEMLRKCDRKERHFTYSDLTDIEFDLAVTTASILSRMGYIKELGRSKDSISVMILPKGSMFIRNDSFISQIEDKEEEQEEQQREKAKRREKDEAEHQLTLKKLRAAKREPYLIAWSIITTITSIILAIMQLIR